MDSDVKCFVVQSKRAPTAHMICSVVAFLSPIARPSAPSVPIVFLVDNNVLTQDLGARLCQMPCLQGSFRRDHQHS